MLPTRGWLAVFLAARLGTSLHAQSIADARKTVRQASRAVEHDSAAVLSAQWTAAMRRDSADRLANLGLASIARLQFRYDEAQRRYQALMASGQSRGARDGVALYARLGHAAGLAARGNPRLADTALTAAAAAARAARDSAGEVDMLLSLAVLRARLTTPAAGAAVLRGVDKRIPATEIGLAARYRCTAIPLQALPAGVQARDAARTGAALARAAGDPQTEATCRFELADALEHSGDLMGAVSVLDTLERLLPRSDSAHMAVVRQHRADDEQALGDYGAAMRSIRSAVAAGEASRNLPVVAYAKMSLAEMYRSLGDLSAAAQAATSAAAVFGETGDRIGRMIADLLRGSIALDVGDREGAREAMQASYAAAESQGEWVVLTMTQLGLADVAARNGAWGDATRSLDGAGATIKRHQLQSLRTQLLFARGTVALHEGRLRDARQALEAGIHTLGPQQHGERYVTIARLAEVDVARGDTVRAERELVSASAELDQWRSTLQDAELRVFAFQKQNSFGGRDPGVATVIAALAKSGRTESAFDLAERRRARELVDRLERTAALGSAGKTTVDSARLSAAAIGGALGRVQAALPDDHTALLEYVMGSETAPTTLFVVTRRAAHAYTLPSADSLSAAVARFDALLQSGPAARAGADALGATLLGPALGDLNQGVRRIVLVPDGALHRTAFEALRVNDRYVVERFAVSTVPSALVGVHLWARQAVAGPAAVLALGDARFPREVAGASGDAETYRSAFNESGGLPRLPGSADEARVVAGFGTHSVVRLRDSASAAYLKHAPLESFRVVHLATHAIVDDQTSTRTALALAGGGGESGFVTPADLAALRLNADLVVLSACRAAGGRIVAGEGVRGLTAPLLAAGARSIVASRWVISDRRTVRLMHDFYRALAEGWPADEALRLAEADALRRGVPAREWATFTLTGDPTVRVALTVPRFDWVWRLMHE